MDWAIRPFRKYATFSGRARRREYWLFVLLVSGISALLFFAEGLLGLRGALGGIDPMMTLFQLAILLPMLAVAARRLHDIGLSGWWLMIAYGPLILLAVSTFAGQPRYANMLAVVSVAGLGTLLVFTVIAGNRGANAYGPDPREDAGAQPPRG